MDFRDGQRPIGVNILDQTDPNNFTDTANLLVQFFNEVHALEKYPKLQRILHTSTQILLEIQSKTNLHFNLYEVSELILSEKFREELCHLHPKMDQINFEAEILLITGGQLCLPVLLFRFDQKKLNLFQRV